MYYHILLTERCDSECSYCYKKSLKEFDNGLDKKFKFDFSSPEESVVDIKKLKKFLTKDENPVLIFYGGEPLMEIEKIEKIMDNIGNVSYRMQTNGKRLDKLPAKYVNKIKRILVSLDGTRKRTDHNRGLGTYDKVMKNLELIRNNGYKGELIARMTLSEFPDIHEQVIDLIRSGFDSVHWQIDAGFFKFDYNKEVFEKFVEEYNASLTKLINFWVKEMHKGTVYRLYPLLAIAESILMDEKTELRCGAGHSGYAITTDSKVVACPIMNCIEDFKAGDLTTDPKDLKKFCVGGKCLKCDYLDLCGGRCLYWNQAGLWPNDGDELICKTIKHLIDSIKKKIPEIQYLIDEKIISKKQFKYEKYFGPEIIP